MTAVVIGLVSSASVEISQAPGRAIFWNPAMASSAAAKGSADYRTISMELPEVDKMLDDHAQKNEIVAVFRTVDGRPIFTHNAIKDSVKQASSPLVMPNIYQPPLSADSEAHGPFDGSQVMGNAQKMNLETFKQLLAARHENGPMFNGRVDSYEVTIAGDATDAAHMKDISALASSLGASCPMMFAAMDAPLQTAVAPTDAQYSRILSTPQGSSNLLDGLFYKPEGAEYSIYYASTYLYITPDIFTGLLTGIFFAFTLLTGYSCLGFIQGNSSFPTKMPIVGKEA